MINSIITAIRTLTIIPIPGKNSDSFQKSIVFFPLTGLIISSLFYFVYSLCLYIPEELIMIRGVILTLFLIIITGGLHLDGLADAADGFLGGKNKESILRILKDSRIGTFGAAAIVFDLSFRIILSEYLVSKNEFLPFLLSIVNSRSVQGIVLTLSPYARGSDGTAAPFSGAKHLFPVIIAIILIFNIVFFLYIRNNLILISLPAALLFVISMVYYFLKRIGGVTGDCIGAVNEFFEITYLFIWCIFI